MEHREIMSFWQFYKRRGQKTLREFFEIIIFVVDRKTIEFNCENHYTIVSQKP